MASEPSAVRVTGAQPVDPSVPNAAGLEALAAGDLQRALDCFERALAAEPRHVAALINKGIALERLGRAADAVTTQRYALQAIPPGARLPASMRGAIEHAVARVRDHDAALANFLDRELESVRREHPGDSLARADHCVDAFVGRRSIYAPRPSFVYFPKLPADEFHARERFPWLPEVEAATDDIAQEVQAVVTGPDTQLEPYIAYAPGVPLDQWTELNHSRRWSAWFLWRDGAPVAEHLEQCPRTAALLASLPLMDVPGYAPTAFFSILDAGTRIPPHTGATNLRLICHLPLVVPERCGLRVGSDTRTFERGRAWVFDDTIEHEAWNLSEAPRAVLIFDVWNPLLTVAERDVMRRAVVAIREFSRDRAVAKQS